MVVISQSGETADTMGAVREAKEKGAQVLAISNVVDSSIPRLSHHAFYTHAGPEIGVASTKAFTTQLVSLVLVRLAVGKQLKNLDRPTPNNPLGRVLLAFKGDTSRIEEDADVAELRITALEPGSGFAP